MTLPELQDKLWRRARTVWATETHWAVLEFRPVHLRIASLNARLPVQDVTIEQVDGKDCVVIVG